MTLVSKLSLKEKINQRLNELNVLAKKSLGQNFLIDQKIVDEISDHVKKNHRLNWVEIGPGLGSLTDELKSHLVFVIELDSLFAKFWKDQGLSVVEVDALKFDWDQMPKSNMLVNETNQKWGLVSNLPYQISSRIVIETSTNLNFETMVLMFQKEVADRIMSSKSDSNYGFLSVIAQNFWEIKKLVFVSPNCFNPRPKVDSQVLTFQKLDTEFIDKSDRKEFVKFVKNCFLERRKKISNKAKKMGLLNEFKDFFEFYNQNNLRNESLVGRQKQQILSLDMRAEEFSPVEFKDLFMFCKNKGKV